MSIHADQLFFGIFFTICCNIMAPRAIVSVTMVGAMAKQVNRLQENDDWVRAARTDAEALGRLYELYYERIFRFCVYRLFNKEIAEDVTSAVFLEVARRIRRFEGRTERDFGNWLYAIAANQANAAIRKSSRRKKLLSQAVQSRVANSTDDPSEPDWPSLYAAILKLKPQHQTIVTLRFFENFSYEQIAKILNVKEATLRVTLHRILNQLRNHLTSVFDGET
jgi:RNA polymerase sigma-70 factor (ECF subfamily)